MFLAFVALLVACTNDPYTSGDSPYSYLRAEMADLHVKNTSITDIMTDAGESIVLTNMTVSEKMARPDTTYRYLLYYNKVEGKREVSLVNNRPVDMLQPCSADKIFFADKDPLSLVSAWKSANGKYLNLCLGLKTGYADDADFKQMLALCLESTAVAEDGHTVYTLSIWHDQAGQPEFYTEEVYCSIPLSDFSEGDELQLKFNTYQGVIVKSFRK